MTDIAHGVTQQALDIVSRLTRAEKIRLTSGKDFWRTEPLDSEGVASFMLTDGPHGLRKQTGDTDHVGLNSSVPATCFPTASALGSTWDADLLEEVGHALGRECRAEEVGVLLGPGLNIKRHPAGGRSFEYFSEDPLVSGKAAAALVRGIQAEGVGACLKHFAANSQETRRMSNDSIVDERTLREIYLTGFEIAVKEAQPWTVMCAYNLVNGVHAGEHRELLTEILRDEWGFDGLVMTDWIATHERPAGIHAGLDLEMPSSAGAWDQRVADAVDAGTLSGEDLDVAAARVITLALKVAAERASRATVDVSAAHDEHHALARRVAAAGATLLTNDGVLPLAPEGRIAVIGAFADKPRFQGGGSALVNPTRLDTVLATLTERIGDAGEVLYAPGYDAATGEATDAQLTDALTAAANADSVVLVVGLPLSYESEGYDRDHLQLPPSHTRLIQALTARHDRVVVVNVGGAPVEMPWADTPNAILQAYLGGQAAGGAITDVLVGDAEPGGRLAESFPVNATDLASHANFATNPLQAQYRENLYVGYRFHDMFSVPARFPFGHGLSYTSFQLGKAKVTGSGTDRTVSVPVTNTGTRAGSTVVQAYVHDVESTLHRPEQELRGFAKLTLEPGQTADAVVTLDERAWAVWDTATHGWVVEAGTFELRLGFSSTDIVAMSTVEINAGGEVTAVPAPASAIATDTEFTALLGRPIPQPTPSFPFHYDSTVADLSATAGGRLVEKALMAQVMKAFGTDPNATDETEQMMQAFMRNMPLRAIAMTSEGKLSLANLDRLIKTLNATALKAKRA
ncbi:glycoside hydrolase family 3 C-terminal domain-containing protein [Demequina sp. NBRC 110051]|uniref:glycoside hydrolase family 3 C-terminal domain-containing protein n=1 Tax=Demequina sp. NBRC 110051 TaxID=1570340 RepID=UPI000A0725A0|nr:glycoside hydrolase family 3 C-terminal domain-containing protein [Demequina sp. NBRC 110051]